MSAADSEATGVGGVGRLRWAPPRRWQLWTRPTHAIIYVLLVDAIAAAITVVSLRHTAVADRQSLYFVVLLAACVLYTEISRGIERVRREYQNTPHVDLHSVWFFAAVLLLPPGLAAVIVAIAGAHRWLRVRHHVVHRRVFATAATIIAIHVASAVLDVLHFDPSARTLVNFGAVAAAGLLYQLTSFTPIAGAIALTIPGPDKRQALGNLRDHTLETATIGLGLLLAWALLDWPVAGLVIAGVTLVLHSTVLIRQLQDSARSDPKTGILNAAGFTEIAQRELNRTARQPGQHTALLLLDIDHFKPINDRYGHRAGDAVIKAVARTISGEIRNYDLVGRWGGDELVTLLPATTGIEAAHVAERIRARIYGLGVPAPTRLGTERLSGITVSIGVAEYPAHGATLDEIIQAADNACYEAKHAGRNTVAYCRTPLSPTNTSPVPTPPRDEPRAGRRT